MRSLHDVATGDTVAVCITRRDKTGVKLTDKAYRWARVVSVAKGSFVLREVAALHAGSLDGLGVISFHLRFDKATGLPISIDSPSMENLEVQCNGDLFAYRPDEPYQEIRVPKRTVEQIIQLRHKAGDYFSF